MKLMALLLGFLLVAAFVPQFIDDPGYIVINISDHIIEFTMVHFAVWFTLATVTFFLLFNLLTKGIHFSLSTWHKLLFANRRRALRNFHKGITAYLLDDYPQAEKLLANSAEASRFEQIAWLTAASAAQKQALPANSEHYLKLLAQQTDNGQGNELESVLVTLKILMAQQKHHDARQFIDQHHKLIGHDVRLLALEIDLCLAEGRFERAIEFLNSARKSKELADERIQGWEDKAFYGAFNLKILAGDNNALQQFWHQQPRKVKQREAVLFAYCRVLSEHQINEPLIKLLQPALSKDLSLGFLKRLRALPISKPEPLLQTVQKQLHKDDHNGKWLSALAHLAVAGKEWSMAEKAFTTLVNLQPTAYDQEDLLAFAKVLSHKGSHQAANEVLLKLVKMPVVK